MVSLSVRLADRPLDFEQAAVVMAAAARKLRRFRVTPPEIVSWESYIAGQGLGKPGCRDLGQVGQAGIEAVLASC